jgi:hypothetical protein
MQASILDDIIDRQPASGRKVYRGIPMLSANSRDQRARYWELYRSAIREDGHQQILWGVPVLAAVLNSGRADILQSAERALLQPGSRTPQLSFGNSHYNLPSIDSSSVPDLYSQRIRYILLPPATTGFKSNLLTTRRTADLVIGRNLPNEGLKDRIALIGNSYEESGDLHETPVGSMPGMYVIGNAINTIVTKSQPTALGGAIVIFLEVAAVCAMAFIMGKDIPFYYILPLFLIALPLLASEVNWLLYRHFGLFFNFTAPLTAMAIYRTGSKLLNSFFKKQKLPKEESTEDEITSERK